MYSPIRRNTRKQYKRFGHKIFFVKCKKNRQIIIKEEGSKEEDRQEEAEVKKKKKNFKNGYADLKRRHQNFKIRKIFKWADRGKHKTSKQDLPTIFGPCFSYNPHCGFFCQANSKTPKVEQVFPHAVCNDHSLVFCLFVVFVWTDLL